MARGPVQEKYGFSLAAKVLALSLGVSLVPIGGLMSFVVPTARGISIDMLRENLLQKTELSTANIHYFLKQREVDAKMLSQADTFETGDRKAIRTFFEEIREANPFVEALLYFDLEGTCRVAAGTADFEGKRLGVRFPDAEPMFAKARAATQGEVLVTEAFPWTTDFGVLFLTPVTDDTNSVTIGVLGVLLETGEIKKAIVDLDESVIGDRYVYVLDDAGNVVYSTDISARIFKPFPDMEKAPELSSLFAAEDARGVVDYSDRMGAAVMAAYADFPPTGSNRGLDWNLVAIAPVRDIVAPAAAMTNLMLLSAAAVGLLVTVASLLFARGLARPVRQMAAALRDIAEGEGDLSSRIESLRARDEVARMAGYFNATFEKIGGLVRAIGEQASALGSSGDELAANMVEASASVNEIAANIESVRALASRQSGEVAQAAEVAGRIGESVSRLDGEIEEQAASVSESSSSIEEMVANVSSVAETLERASETIDSLAESSELGKAGMDEISSFMSDVMKESDGLLEAIAIIKGIADQTNLLAMNAAIEAAHAGDFGRGFAVVADEIRKLAETSASQGAQISAVLSRLKESIGHVTELAKTTQERFDAIWSLSQATKNQEAVIKQAMREQDSGGREVLKAIREMNEITARVREGSNQALSGSAEIAAVMERLDRLTHEIDASMAEMANGTRQVNDAVAQVKDLGLRNRESVHLLNEELGRFKY